MVLGILGLLLCGLLAPVALAMGLSARRRIRGSGGYIGGDGQATAGIVMGAIGTALIAIGLIIAAVVIIIAVNNTSGGY